MAILLLALHACVTLASQGVSAIMRSEFVGNQRPTASAHAETIAGAAAVLLEDGRVLIIDLANGRHRSQASGPPVPLLQSTQFGNYFARASDGKIIVLSPGSSGQPGRLLEIDPNDLSIRPLATLVQGREYVSIIVGPETGRIFAISRFGLTVDVLAPANGQTLATWHVEMPPNRNWSVFSSAMSADERKLLVSYHGNNTTGIDVFDVSKDGLTRCTSPTASNLGCIISHGTFVLSNDRIIAATGGPDVSVFSSDGRKSESIPTGLLGHLMTIAVSPQTKSLLAVTSCLRSGSLSRQHFPAQAPGAAPAIRPTCGERIVLSQDEQLAIVQGISELTVIRTTTAESLAVVDLPANVLDVIFVR